MMELPNGLAICIVPDDPQHPCLPLGRVFLTWNGQVVPRIQAVEFRASVSPDDQDFKLRIVVRRIPENEMMLAEMESAGKGFYTIEEVQ